MAYLSFKKGFLTEQLNTSQKQAVIKLLEKKIDRDKKLIKNWRPISLLNTDIKLISKALAKRIKKLLSSLILLNQIAYLENRFISEESQLIADILKITNILKTNKVAEL